MTISLPPASPGSDHASNRSERIDYCRQRRSPRAVVRCKKPKGKGRLVTRPAAGEVCQQLHITHPRCRRWHSSVAVQIPQKPAGSMNLHLKVSSGVFTFCCHPTLRLRGGGDGRSLFLSSLHSWLCCTFLNRVVIPTLSSDCKQLGTAVTESLNRAGMRENQRTFYFIYLYIFYHIVIQFCFMNARKRCLSVDCSNLIMSIK